MTAHEAVAGLAAVQELLTRDADVLWALVQTPVQEAHEVETTAALRAAEGERAAARLPVRLLRGGASAAALAGWRPTSRRR